MVFVSVVCMVCFFLGFVVSVLFISFRLCVGLGCILVVLCIVLFLFSMV